MKHASGLLPNHVNSKEILGLLQKCRQAQGRWFVLPLLAVMLLRSGSHFFHTHATGESNGYSLAAACAACDVEATLATESPDPAPLPILVSSPIAIAIRSEAHPFVSSTLTTTGRAPPVG